MIKSWDNICNFYEQFQDKNNVFKNMFNLVTSIKNSKYSNYIYGWTSMYELYIVQTKVEYPYDGPRLLISPLENNKLEFRYIDTYCINRQWKRIFNADEGFLKLESFFFSIHWFYPNFTNDNS
ncbi:MAG: hypothetical protein Q8900_02185 [Bacillota bacterium]|nr:hypothetical protein [Bacillota bacterium]